jgi:nucleotide-binding universal stress UspA family protein
MALDTILLAVGPGDSERVERLGEEAVDVAVPTDARVVVLHVFTDGEFTEAATSLDFDLEASEVTPDEVASRHRTVRRLARMLDEAGVEFDLRGAVGDHGEEIVAVAKAVGADRVLVGGRRRSPAGKAVFGSTAQEVMLSAPCPVTFVRADTT